MDIWNWDWSSSIVSCPRPSCVFVGRYCEYRRVRIVLYASDLRCLIYECGVEYRDEILGIWMSEIQTQYSTLYATHIQEAGWSVCPNNVVGPFLETFTAS